MLVQSVRLHRGGGAPSNTGKREGTVARARVSAARSRRRRRIRRESRAGPWRGGGMVPIVLPGKGGGSGPFVSLVG